MFAYLISKLLCNINRDVRAPKSASLERTKTSFGSVETLRETYLESLLKLLVGKIIFYVFIVIFTSEISLVISLHDWFTLGALAADKNSFITRSKVVSRKVLNGLHRKRSLSKRRRVRIILPLPLINALRKSRRKVFCVN